MSPTARWNGASGESKGSRLYDKENLLWQSGLLLAQVSNAPVLLFADYNAANGREKKNPRENVSMKDARNDCGKVLCDDSK